MAAAAALLASGTLAACGNEGDSSTDASASAGSDGGLRVEVTPPRTTPGATVQAAVVNDTGEKFTYGAAYELERQVGGDFEQVKLPERAVIQIAYVAKPGESGPPVDVNIPGDALEGRYRVVIQRDVPEIGDLSSEFEVRADS